MKTLRSSILCLVVLLLTSPLLRAQDLSKYRHFTLGMSLTKLLERTEEKITDVKMIHGRPALIQELIWWPPNVPGTSVRADSVEQIPVFEKIRYSEKVKSILLWEPGYDPTDGSFVRAIGGRLLMSVHR